MVRKQQTDLYVIMKSFLCGGSEVPVIIDAGSVQELQTHETTLRFIELARALSIPKFART
jgi:hypothetical protein